MFNKSAIMKRAWSIYKEKQVSKSTALHQAWLEAKMEIIEGRRFLLKMKDHGSNHDFQLDYELSTAWHKMNDELKPKPETTGLSAEALADLMLKILNSPGETDWNLYSKLEREYSRLVAGWKRCVRSSPAFQGRGNVPCSWEMPVLYTMNAWETVKGVMHRQKMYKHLKGRRN